MPQTLKLRERQVLTMMAEGLSAPAIAQRLSLSADTVRWYIKQLYALLEVSSRAEAIRVAMSRGLLDAPVQPAASAPVSRSEIRYANNAGVHVAYQIVGSGPVTLLFMHGFVSHLDLAWEQLEYAAFFEQLGRVARVILFDKRGVGVSDRQGGPATIEQTVADARCVLDAAGTAGTAHTFIMGTSEGGAAAVLLASMYPERVHGLILFGVSPFIGGHGTEFPWTSNGDGQYPLLTPAPERWGETWSLDRFAPSRADQLDFRNWWSRLLRAATSPSVIDTVLANARAVDIRALLPSITTRTLVIHRIGDRLVPLAAGRYFAARMPHARMVELPGNDHVYFIDSDALARTVTAYLQQPDAATDVRTWIAIILCMTGRGARLDGTKRAILSAHDARFLRQSDSTWTALFDSPSTALRCARELRTLGAGTVGAMSLHVGACSVAEGVPVGAAYSRAVEAALATAPGHIVLTGMLRDILAGADVSVAVHALAAGDRDAPPSAIWALVD
ncbi:alpha/beta fold hydrolase [Gemmatimonas groenlandica]|uniref:Alpha/beta fold hydrolase n=1 Tax=Gemmatimonas groenlandica TaxID=2732249 RepID=A0A6M4IR19_9BACT|nr:alpha/beta fold hydrolase [Gemmatimonas groenlandica]QJR35826.1 alpha/beta fold hydrolase [Gemmatimonas groenlandica]